MSRKFCFYFHLWHSEVYKSKTMQEIKFSFKYLSQSILLCCIPRRLQNCGDIVPPYLRFRCLGVPKYLPVWHTFCNIKFLLVFQKSRSWANDNYNYTLAYLLGIWSWILPDVFISPSFIYMVLIGLCSESDLHREEALWNDGRCLSVRPSVYICLSYAST